MTDKASEPAGPQDDAACPAPDGAPSAHGHGKAGFLALALGSIGVVFGDIGTSPLYAMREALPHAARRRRRRAGGARRRLAGPLGADPDRHGQVRHLPDARRQQGRGRHPGPDGAGPARARRGAPASVFLLGMVGAALFYGDGIITPGDLGAVGGRGPEGRAGRRPTRGRPMCCRSRPAILVAPVHGPVARHGQRGRGSSGRSPRSGSWSWPGWACSTSPTTSRSSARFSPHYGVAFLIDNGFLGFVILGSVFLAVTGAEALYADMGHFGRRPDPRRLAGPGPALPDC